jgi:enolase-phosphatase E1
VSPSHSFRADAALIDIEGTISPTAFVRETLFGYSRGRIADYVKANAGEREVESILEQTRDLEPDRDPVETLDDWQARDVKAPPLKALQGLIWESRYASGAFTSPIFPDALEALRRWRKAGVRLYVYSSGSRHAQDLFFRHNEAGDVRRLFSDFFDTGVGSKTERGSYVAIGRAIGTAPDAILFLSDSAAELRAAESAGLQVAQAVKEASLAEPRWTAVADFSTINVAPRP